jgi:hypothetical protein
VVDQRQLDQVGQAAEQRRTAGGRQQDVAVRAEVGERERPLRHGQLGERGVQRALGHLGGEVGPGALAHLEAQAGQAREHGRQHLRQHAGRQRGAGTDAQAVAGARRQLFEVGLGGAEPREDPLGVLEQQIPGGRQRGGRAAALAHDQPAPDDVLQVGDLL